MKVRSVVIAFSLFLSFSASASVYGQLPVAPENFTKDETVKSSNETVKSSPSKNVLTQRLPSDAIFAPEIAYVNFDDLIFYDDNSVQIAPNRYPGLTFYSPYSNSPTWLTSGYRYTVPNSLVAGTPVWNGQLGYNEIYSSDRIIVDFASPSKDVGFLWGQSNYAYTSGWIDVYTDTMFSCRPCRLVSGAGLLSFLIVSVSGSRAWLFAARQFSMGVTAIFISTTFSLRQSRRSRRLEYWKAFR